MARRSMIIVGAGVAGLSTGCYAQMSGYSTRIFELHDRPGGCCTSWRRKGYTFDYCIHNLSGTAQGSAFHPIWRELGAFEGLEVQSYPELVRIEAPEGRALTLRSDLDRLEQEMLSMSPRDRAVIGEYVRALRKARGIDATALVLGGRMAMLRLLPKLGMVRKWGPVTVAQFAQRFQDPFLRRAMAVAQYGIPEVPMIVHLSMLAALGKGDMGWPVGGSFAFAKNIERRYLKLGGEASYRSRVVKVIVEEGRAKGVVLEDGSEHRADMVVSAADGHATIFGMLGGSYLSERLREYYAQVPSTQEFGLEVFLGVDRDLSAEAHALALFIEPGMEVEGRSVERLDVELFSSGKGMAPPGKGVIKVVFPSSYDYWKGLRQKGPEYDSEKRRLAERVVERLSARFPGLGGQVEAVDVMTPVTVERYLGAHRGLQAWAPKLDAATLMKEGLATTLPGLSDFYLVGQFAQGMVGLSTAAASARKLVMRICKEDGARFQAGE